MDPLSIIASCVAIATPLTLTVRRLRSVQHGREDLMSLSNGVSEVVILLHELRSVMSSPRPQHDNAQTMDLMLVATIRQVGVELSRLASEISRLSSRSGTNLKSTTRHGLRQIALPSAIKQLRLDFEQVRSQLQLALAATTASKLARVELTLQDIILVQDPSTTSAPSASQRHAEHDPCDSEVAKTLIERTPQGPSHSSPVASHPGGTRGTSTTTQTSFDQRHAAQQGSVLFASSRMTAVAAVGLRTAQFRRSACDPWCSCACHKERHLRTPGFLQPLIGALFIGYSGLPVLRAACDQFSCRLQSQPVAYATYFFPRWFLARMVSMVMSFTPLAGPAVSIDVKRAVPGSSDIFTFAKVGNVNGIRALFEEGRASPHDVHFDSGVTALHLAINHKQIDVCKFLLKANADPFLIDNTSCSSADNAWTKIFSGSLPTVEEQSLRALFSESECIERREFTILHKISLGLLETSMEQMLSASTSDINARDNIGRTALSFTAERSDLEGLQTLLRWGADARLASFCGEAPLHYAAHALEPDCIQPLIDAGAQVDCTTNWDQTPLHLAAAYNKDSRHARLLIDAGADVNHRDRDGISPLGWCAISNNVEVAALLLEHRATIDDADNDGITTLQNCIQFNRHSILEIVLTMHAHSELCSAPRKPIWGAVETSADNHTLELLRRYNFGGQNAGREILLKRMTSDEKAWNIDDMDEESFEDACEMWHDAMS